MCPVEGKFCLFYMVKLPESPAVGVVAHFTLFTQIFFVNIILSMTFHAPGWAGTEVSPSVTLLAWGNPVHANQGEGTHIMVEENFISPSLIIVAVLAHLSLWPPVHTITQVAFLAFPHLRRLL